MVGRGWADRQHVWQCTERAEELVEVAWRATPTWPKGKGKVGAWWEPPQCLLETAMRNSVSSGSSGIEVMRSGGFWPDHNYAGRS